MQLRIYLVFILVYTYGHGQPLPSSNPELVQRFRTILDLTLGSGIGMLAGTIAKEDAPTRNVMLSPISATVLTAELLLGKSEKLLASESDLYRQLASLLQLLESAPNGTKHFVLKRQDAVFVSNKITFSTVYTKNLKALYDTPVHFLDFGEDAVGAQRLINSWGSRFTNGHVKFILSSPPPPSTSSIFASACYLQANWQMPFGYALNKSQFFSVNPTKKIPITYLTQQFDRILYGESSDYLITALPYTNEEVGLYIILPKYDNLYKYDLKSFIPRITFEGVQETITKAQRHDVFVKLPKISLSRSFSIRKDLMENVGLKQENIDLAGAVAHGSLRVDDVIHQAVVNFDQKNVEFSDFVTLGNNLVGGVRNFIVDRPFVFFIRHEATTAMLFIGAVSDPTD